MKIEVGKKYRTRGGSVVAIDADEGDGFAYPWYGIDQSGQRHSWTRCGRCVDGSIEHSMDLVEEIVDEPAAAPSAKEGAFAAQVGGHHYTDMAIQPMEFFMANRIPYPEASVIGYVSRWREKGGVQDLEKARHTIDMIIEAVNNGKYS